jgi:hypothetical protein
MRYLTTDDSGESAFSSIASDLVEVKVHHWIDQATRQRVLDSDIPGARRKERSPSFLQPRPSQSGLNSHKLAFGQSAE